MKKRKSCLVIGYMNMNYGDDLFFDILFRRYKKVDFYFYPPSVLLSQYKKLFSKYKNVKFYDNEEDYLKIREDITDINTPINLFPSILKRAEKVDFYINIGGSIFIENPNWKNDDRYEIKKQLGNKPSFIVGCNFGPGTQEYIEYLKEWFKNFDDICFRDKKSYNIFKTLSNIRLADDIVLSYKKRNFNFKRRSLGVSLISVKEELEESLLNFSKNTIKEFINNNYRIYIYIFCTNDGDAEITNKLLKKFDEKDRNKIEFIEYKDSINKFYKHFSRNKYLLGTRFHSIILGILNNQKILPIIYSEKTRDYLKDLGYNYDDFSIINLNNKNVKKEDFKKINFRKREEKAFDKIDKYLKNN